MVCFVVTQHSESDLSLCLRYSKTSCRRQLKNPFKETVNCQTVTPVIDDTDNLWGWHYSVLRGILLYEKTTHNTFEALWVVDMFLLT